MHLAKKIHWRETEAGREFKHGDHACILFNKEQERFPRLHSFIEQSVHAGDRFVYIADAPSLNSFPQWLDGFVKERNLPAKSFQFETAASAYIPDGEFQAARMLDVVDSLINSALEHNYSGMSGTGEMTWANTNIEKFLSQLIIYEKGLNELVCQKPSALLCQYDTSKFRGDVIFDILLCHPIVILGGLLIKNPLYSAGKTPDPDKTMLSQIIMVQSVINILSEPLKVFQFIAKAVTEILQCVNCSYTFSPAEAEKQPNKKVLGVKNATRCYGYVILEITHARRYAELEYLILHLLNTTTMALDNQWQREKMECEIMLRQDTEKALYAANEKLKELAHTDPLTGLLNRRALLPAALKELHRCRRMDHAFSLCVVDVDNFKQVNDTLGHGAGDDLLLNLAGMMQSVLRKDVDLCFRVGGDEFLIILPECDKTETLEICTRFKNHMPALSKIASLSTGFSSIPADLAYPERDEDSEGVIGQMIKLADKLMYADKKERARGFAL